MSDTFSDARINTADGIRIDLPDGWVHLRPSNTEPIVRLIAEAPTRERAWKLIDEVAAAAGLRTKKVSDTFSDPIEPVAHDNQIVRRSRGVAITRLVTG